MYMQIGVFVHTRSRHVIVERINDCGPWIDLGPGYGCVSSGGSGAAEYCNSQDLKIFNESYRTLIIISHS